MKFKRTIIFGLGLMLTLGLNLGESNSKIMLNSKMDSLNQDPSKPRYYKKYASIEEARVEGNKINERIAEEGIALFKNEPEIKGGTKKTLPLKKNSRISLFGSCSTNLRQSGGGSGSGQSNPGEYQTTQEIFNQAGFIVNPKLYSMYEKANSRNEIGMSNCTDDIKDSYKEYNDAAIIFISRADGGENYDANLGDGKSRHSQQLNDNEKALFEHVKNAKDSGGGYLFEKIILCINTADPFEVADFQDDERVQGVIWMGLLGSTGLKALPKILNGDVTPSAHTVDIWPANLRKDPAWFNFGTNKQVGGSINITGKDPSGNKLEEAIAEDGVLANPIFKALTYKEGIYMGYRWYETASTIDGYFNNVVDTIDYSDPLHETDAYYNRYNGVLYPFGYGLSYTEFEWKVGQPSLKETTLTENDAGTDITIPVTVKNIGEYAGKDVVQLYAREPYDTKSAPIEKSDVTFINSAKTKLLQPGEEDTVKITFNVRDLSSFDWNDINGNGFKGYELEPGDYDLLFRTDSHNDKNEGLKVTYKVDSNIKYNSDELDSPLNYNQYHGENAKAVFSEANEYNSSGIGAIDEEGNHAMKEDADYVSRSDFKLPTPSTKDQLAWTDKAVDILLNQTYTSSAGTNGDKTTDPWYKTSKDIPGWNKTRSELTEGDWWQASENDVKNRVNGKTKIQLKDMIGVDFKGNKWINFMNQLSFDEMTALTQDSWYKSPSLDAIGKIETRENDGPGQISYGEKSTFWCCETTIAATYNTELAYEMGYQMGQECLLLNVYGRYGPGMNTHRLAFNGRNFEYYSSDGRQGGYIGAAVIKGAVDNGIHIYAKHYVCNDMETNRNYGGGVSIFLTEQSLREIYLKPFEIATKIGGMNGIMTCHGKIGVLRSESNYNLVKYFLYDECGYTGSSVTDADAGSYTTVIGGSAQQVTGDRLERCFVNPLAWNHTPASSDSALNGRKVEGRYDDVNNKLMVPEIFVNQDKWHFTGEHDGYEETTGYQTEITNSGKWDQESPTQWYAVRMNCQYLLYQVANSAAMGLGNGDQLGAIVTIHNNSDQTPDSELKMKIGDLLTEPEPPAVNLSKERFAGWFLDYNCTEPAKFPITITKPIHLYASIVPMTSCVQTYDLNYDGAPTNITAYYEVGSLVSLPQFDPVRPGYKFDGWYLEKTCIKKVDPNNIDSMVINSDRTYYAKWIAIKKVIISFYYNYDGSPSPKIMSIDVGSTMLPPTFAPSRSGYIFTGWYTDAACEYAVDFSQGFNYDTKIYAGWKEIGNIDGDNMSKDSTSSAPIYIGVISTLGILLVSTSVMLILNYLKNRKKGEK